MKSNFTSIRVFQNPLLESFTHVPVWLPAAAWLPVAGFYLARAATAETWSIPAWSAIALSALLFWSLTEYVLHRFVFHAKFAAPALNRLTYLVHGIHHDAPMDATRLLMPPLASLPLAIAFYWAFRLLLGTALGEAFFAFFLLGYLIYDYIHYSTHHVRSSIYYWGVLKKNHMLHHFDSDKINYGVSSPLWDWVFGTKL